MTNFKKSISLGLISLFMSGISPIHAAEKLQGAQIANDYRKANEVKLLNDFKDLLSMPNISSSKKDMMKNANWITKYLQKRNFTTEIWTAGRAPYVFAERKVKGAKKTVLIYAHFDGQPVDPKNWASDPFTLYFKGWDD